MIKDGIDYENLSTPAQDGGRAAKEKRNTPVAMVNGPSANEVVQGEIIDALMSIMQVESK